MLREQIREDLEILFDELSEVVSIDGRQVNVITDNELLKDYEKKELEPLYKADVLFFVRKTDMPNLKTGSILKFGNKHYSVDSMNEDSNILEVRLCQYGA